MAQINELSEIISLSTDDKFPIYDTSASATRKVSFGNVINDVKTNIGFTDFGGDLVQVTNSDAAKQALEIYQDTITDYTSLRAYDGSANLVRVFGAANFAASPGATNGIFAVDLTDTTSTDNGGTIIIDAKGRRWKRQFSGAVYSNWFNSTLHLGIQSALDAGYNYIKLPNEQTTVEWLGQVNIPPSRIITIEGGGGTIFVAPNITAMVFQRGTSANTGTKLYFKNNGGLVVENGLGKTATFINFKGRATSSGVVITRSGAVATVTTPSAHGLATGALIEIQGCDQTQYNGRFTCTVVDATHYTYPVTGTPATPATGAICMSGFETANYNDNAIFVSDTEFRGFYRVKYTERTGGGISKVKARFNSTVWESGRDTSFFKVDDYLGVSNVSDLYYLDVFPNGLSNGVTLNNVYSVLATGAGSVGAMYFKGIEGLNGKGNSIDLCAGAVYAFNAYNCTSMDLEFTWLASDLSVAPAHRGFYVEDCYKSKLKISNLVNQLVGGWVRSYAAPTQPIFFKADIDLFYGVTNLGVLFQDVVGGSIAAGYKFTSACPRTGTDYEFYALSTNNYNHIGKGMMRGTSYTISGFGANSVVDTPIFIP